MARTVPMPPRMTQAVRSVRTLVRTAERLLKQTRQNAALFVFGACVLTGVVAVGVHHVILQPFWVDAESGVGEASGTGTFTPTFADNGVQVSRSSDTDREQVDPSIISDGSTGSIIVYEDDNATDGTYNIYAQRFGSTGTPWWTSGGVRVAASSSNQTDPIALADGSGGAVIVWSEGSGGTPTRIVGVKIDSSGAVSWGPTTFFVHPDVGGVCLTGVSPSGSGGLVLGWTRNDSGTYTSETSAINSSGSMIWTTAGLTQGSSCTKAPVYADPANNAAYTAFPESTGRTWGYVQKYNLTTGAAQYAGNGVQVGVPGQADYTLGIGTDGSSGFHVIVGGDRFSSCGGFCNNVTSTLRAVRGNDSATSTVTLMSDEQYASSFTSSFYDTTDPGEAVGDSSGNMYVVSTWVDSGQQGTVVAQKVTSGGVNSWGSSITGGSGSMATALAIDTDTDETAYPKIILDGTGGAYVSWIQSHAFLADADVYGQHVDSTGAVQWTAASQRMLDTSVASGDGNNVGLFRASTTPWFVWDRNNDVYVQSGTEVAGSSGSSSNTNTSTGGTTESGFTAPSKVIPGIPLALSPTSIRWHFSDTSEYESGFQLDEEADGQVPRILYTTAPIFTKNLSFIDETGLTPNTRYCDRVVYVFNDKGISPPSSKFGCTFTQVNPPGRPSASIINPLLIRVSWSDNGNPAHTEYAILEKVRGLYVQADGTFGGTPAWRTLAQWGPDGVLVHLPSTGAPYSFAVQARNGDGLTTAALDTNLQNPATLLLIERRVAIQSSSADGSVFTAPVYLDDGRAVQRGERLQYQTFVKNESTRDAQSLVLSDVVPLGTQFVPGSIYVNGEKQTDTAADDAGTYDGGAVVVTQPSLPAGRMLLTSYTVAVTAPSGDIQSRGCASSLEDPDGQCSNTATNPVVGAVPVNTNQNANVPVNQNRNTNLPSNRNTNAPQANQNANTNQPEPEVIEEEPATSTPVAGPVLVNGKSPDAPSNDPTPEISGTTDPETRVTVAVDGVVAGTTVSDGAGHYVVDMSSPLSDGSHRLVITADGQEIFAGDFSIDTLPPPPPLTLGLEIVKIGVVRRSGIDNSIVEVRGQTTPETALVRLIIQSDPVIVTFPPPSLSWSKQVEAPLEAGEHTATAIAIDNAGNESAPVSRTFIVPELQEEGSALEQFAVLLDEVRTFLNQPAVQTVNAVVSPVVVVAAVANVATAAGFGSLYGFFGLLFTQPVLLFGRRRRKGFGTVYNAFSKLPVDLAIIRVRDAATQRVLHTKVTDKEGRYMFFLAPGGYQMEVVKPGFAYPSEVMRGRTEDPAYTDVQPTPQVRLETATRLAKNLPVDPVAGERTPAAIQAAAAARRIQHLVAISGPLLSIVSLAVTPTLFVGGLVILQFAAYALFRRLAYVAPPKSFGTVWDAKKQVPMPGVAVRIFEATYNKLLETQVTDARGRYAFLVGRNRFYITASAPGYITFRSPLIDRTQGEERGLITNTISLSPGADAPPAPLPPPGPVTPPQPPSLPPRPSSVPQRPPQPPARPTPTANRPPTVAPSRPSAQQPPAPRIVPPGHGSV